MTKTLKIAAIVLLASASQLLAQAQPAPPNPALTGPPPAPPPPPPAGPPPPSMAVPKVPKMDEPAKPDLSPQKRSSYGDRVINCLSDGYAARLGPNDRAAYSRYCAN